MKNVYENKCQTQCHAKQHYTPVSQLVPVYPTGHWQVYASPDADATHTPPCWQGLDAHALTHLMPVDAWMAKNFM